jgi:hypothetical protein
MMKAAVSEGAAQPFMKEEKEQGELNSFRGEAVGVAGSVTLQQGMAFELAQIVAQLSEDGLVELLAVLLHSGTHVGGWTAKDKRPCETNGRCSPTASVTSMSQLCGGLARCVEGAKGRARAFGVIAFFLKYPAFLRKKGLTKLPVKYSSSQAATRSVLT